MELLQLKYFLELAESQHLTRVAERMYVSPSAISSSIARLEAELGVKLFDRIGRNIKLNDYGQAYLPYVKNALNELIDGEKAMFDMSISSDNHVTIVMSNPYLWLDTLHEFSRKYPEINFKHFLFDPALSPSKEPHADVDLMIMAPESYSDLGWESTILFEDRIALAVPPYHRFAGRKTISLIEAKDEWFVNLSDSLFSQYCDILFQEAGFEPKSRITCDYMLRPEVAFREGMVALTTFNAQKCGLYSNMILIPLEDEKAVRHQSLHWKKDRYLSKPAQLLKDFLIEKYHDFSFID